MRMGSTLLVVTAAGVVCAATVAEAHELAVGKHYHAELVAPVRAVDAVRVTVSGFDARGFAGRYPYTLTVSGAWS